MRLQAIFGLAISIGLVALANRFLIGNTGMPLIITPIGASATLLFGMPESSIARPWAIIGGSTVSAGVGVLIGLLVPDEALACPVAVVGAVLMMMMLHCFHPPACAVALAAVLGNSAVRAAGFSFALIPICLDCLLIVLAHRAIHRLIPPRRGK